jgi:hypothetical protein
MPWDLVKFNKGFKVCKSDNYSDCASNKELSLDTAVKQRRALYLAERRAMPGSRSRSRSRSRSGGSRRGVTVHKARGKETVRYYDGKIIDTKTGKVKSYHGAKYSSPKRRSRSKSNSR